MNSLIIYTFGYGHGFHPALPGQPDLVANVSTRFHDPHIDPGLRNLTGLDQRVVDKMLKTPGAYQYARTLHAAARDLRYTTGGDVVLVIGCVGGRHRSVVIGNWVAAIASRADWLRSVDHLHINEPIIERPVPAMAELVATPVPYCVSGNCGHEDCREAIRTAVPDQIAPTSPASGKLAQFYSQEPST